MKKVYYIYEVIVNVKIQMTSYIHLKGDLSYSQMRKVFKYQLIIAHFSYEVHLYETLSIYTGLLSIQVIKLK